MMKIIQPKQYSAPNNHLVFSAVFRALVICLKKGAVGAMIVAMGLGFSLSSFAQFTVESVSQSEKELKIKHMLEGLQKKYNLSPWIYTEKVLVDAGARTPHSHPVLTMSTQPEYLNSEIQLLSTFLHEQFHRHIVENSNAPKDEFRKEIKVEFPDVQFARPFGSGDEGGTLNHLVVCYLEFKALESLVGQIEATEALAAKRYYTWIYETVLDARNHDKLEKLINRFELQIDVDSNREA
ncbi:MAG: hypothetical protein K0U59_00050 [Gammaproteobacteria bacterium]|nr:hypothetical protein [Gammaproteobacteria bacterium]